jgi:L-threonylcarbamoyladenylate synthase
MVQSGRDIQQAKRILEDGDLVAVPTETVYGLAGNALDVSAVLKIFQVKQRPAFDPLIVHVPDMSRLSLYVESIPEKAKILCEKFWPGPLTILFKKKNIIPDLVTSGLDTVGIRCPDHPLTRQLLSELNFPLAAPSANPFGYVSPTTALHVADQLGDKISYILDGGTCPVGLESTIVGFEGDATIVYRLGGLSLENIESVIGKVQLQAFSSSNPKAPGQLKSHYAPRKKVILGNLEEILKHYPLQTSGILSFQKNYAAPFQYILSPEGKLDEAAHNLFTALRTFDKMGIDQILAEFVPDHGLGRAINDRLRRASAGTHNE